MTDWLEYVQSMGRLDQAFLAVVAAIAVLVVLSIVFAGLTVRLRIRNDRKAEKWAHLEAEWEPLMLDVLAGEASARVLQAAVRPEDRLPFLTFLLRYHRRVSGDEREILRRLAERHLPLLRPKVHSRSAETRSRAVQTLAELGLPEHLDVVIEALDDESPIVQLIAARAIFRKRVVLGYEAVLDRLSAFSLWSRQFLSSMLVTGGPEGAPLLGEVVRDRSRALRDRTVALYALKDLHDLSTVDLAAEILATESERELVTAALRAVEELGWDKHAPLVRRQAGSSDEVIRAAALGALGSVGDESDFRLLAARIEDDSAWVALEAARGLRELGARDVLSQIAAGDDGEAILARQVLLEGA